MTLLMRYGLKPYILQILMSSDFDEAKQREPANKHSLLFLIHNLQLLGGGSCPLNHYIAQIPFCLCVIYVPNSHQYE